MQLRQFLTFEINDTTNMNLNWEKTYLDNRRVLFFEDTGGDFSS